MDNLNIRNFESIGQLTGALEQVISGDQPLQRALTVLRDNTQPGVFSEKLSAKERDEARQSRTTSYSPVSGMSSPRKTLPWQYRKTKKARCRPCISNSPSCTATCWQSRTRLYQEIGAESRAVTADQNSSDPIFATRQMAKTLPAPLNRWVGRLTDRGLACGDGGGCTLYGSGLARQRGETV